MTVPTTALTTAPTLNERSEPASDTIRRVEDESPRPCRALEETRERHGFENESGRTRHERFNPNVAPAWRPSWLNTPKVTPIKPNRSNRRRIVVRARRAIADDHEIRRDGCDALFDVLRNLKRRLLDHHVVEEGFELRQNPKQLLLRWV